MNKSKWRLCFVANTIHWSDFFQVNQPPCREVQIKQRHLAKDQDVTWFQIADKNITGAINITLHGNKGNKIADPIFPLQDILDFGKPISKFTKRFCGS